MRSHLGVQAVDMSTLSSLLAVATMLERLDACYAAAAVSTRKLRSLCFMKVSSASLVRLTLPASSQTGDVRISHAEKPQRPDFKVATADGAAAPPHLVAAHAAWFDWERIADVERTRLPEFFDGRSHAKTPQVCLLAMSCMPLSMQPAMGCSLT